MQHATFASYYVARWIAKQRKPYTVTEDLVKPAAINKVCYHLWKWSCSETATDSTVKLYSLCTYYNMSKDIKQVIAAINASEVFIIKLD
jgi:hypothetical protein